ncbi:hypothetical protein BHM03_00054795 [Ensete ventricosum]|nr:hypothetical protein BHM03_00054795 [Ensete ventricosum]
MKQSSDAFALMPEEEEVSEASTSVLHRSVSSSPFDTALHLHHRRRGRRKRRQVRQSGVAPKEEEEACEASASMSHRSAFSSFSSTTILFDVASHCLLFVLANHHIVRW